MTKWKVLSSGFLIKQLFFEKSHFLHPHAQKTNQKLSKSFTFELQKSKKIQKFHFSKNASRWLLMTPNEFLSTPGPQNIFWKPPCTLRTHQKIFDKIDFWAWKCIFQVSRPSELEKTHFWAKFKGQNFFTNFVSWPTTPEGASIGPNEKICRADFWLSTYFLKNFIFCILMLKKLAKS